MSTSGPWRPGVLKKEPPKKIETLVNLYLIQELTVFTRLKVNTFLDFFQNLLVVESDTDPQTARCLPTGQPLQIPCVEEWTWDGPQRHLSSPSVAAVPCAQSVLPTKKKLPQHTHVTHA